MSVNQKIKADEQIEKRFGKAIDKINTLKTELINAETLKNTKLKDANEIQNGIIQDLQNALNQQVIENNALIADDELDEAEKARLQNEINSLEITQVNALSSLQSQLESANAQLSAVDPDCPQQYVNARSSSANIRTSPAPK